jgi:hypothetical protein
LRSAYGHKETPEEVVQLPVPIPGFVDDYAFTIQVGNCGSGKSRVYAYKPRRKMLYKNSIPSYLIIIACMFSEFFKPWLKQECKIFLLFCGLLKPQQSPLERIE